MIITIVACAASVAGWLNRCGWLFDLVSHFRVQCAAVLLFGAVVLSLTHRHALLAVVAAGGVLVQLSAVLPLYRWRGPHVSHEEKSLRVVFANVWWFNHAYQRIARFLKEAAADIVVLEEISEQGLTALKQHGLEYPFSKMAVRSDAFCMVLLSRLPLEEATSISLGVAGVPSIVARVRVGSTRLTLMATHPWSPMTRQHAAWRNEQLERLAEFAAQQEGPVMLVGDLNTTSWTAVFRRFLRRSRLRDSRQGFGMQPSWPAFVPLLRIPIDHCLVSAEVAVRRRVLGPAIGSDHLPVVVDVAVA